MQEVTSILVADGVSAEKILKNFWSKWNFGIVVSLFKLNYSYLFAAITEDEASQHGIMNGQQFWNIVYVLETTFAVQIYDRNPRLIKKRKG